MWDLIVSVPDHCLSFYFTTDSCSKSVFLVWMYVFFFKFGRVCIGSILLLVIY